MYLIVIVLVIVLVLVLVLVYMASDAMHTMHMHRILHYFRNNCLITHSIMI